MNNPQNHPRNLVLVLNGPHALNIFEQSEVLVDQPNGLDCRLQNGGLNVGCEADITACYCEVEG